MATNTEGGADGAQAPKLAKQNLNYVFHHIFLPPKLPGGQDSSGEKDEALINFVLDSLRLFSCQAHPDHTAAVKAAMCMTENMKDARCALGMLRELGTQSVLSQIYSNGIAPSLIFLVTIILESLASFHITAQNAGVVIYKVTTSVILEVFELSPTNSSVQSTRGRLQRQFPASAIAVPSDLFDNEDFRSVLGKTLVKMSQQPVDEMQPKVQKAKEIHNEERDTVDPRLVTELLVSFLRGCGKQVNVRGICKNTREEVMWNQSKLPWRRSPVWLLLRVSLQLTMNRVATDSGDAYKSFMVFFLSRILEASVQQSPGHVLHTMRTKISRRLLKLENPKEGAWLGTVRDTLSRTSHQLEDKWQRLCVDLQPPLDLTAVSSLKMDEDVFFDLCKMDQFISSILQHDNPNQLSLSSPTSQLQVFGALSLPQVSSIKQDYLPFHLAMVESWVAANLESWIERHVGVQTTCLELSRLIRNYHASAISWYANRPEGASRMHLVILELWIAADKAALYAFPILQHYEPEIPFQVYQALLLGLQGDMARLARAEAYLHQRQKFTEAQQRPSVFSSFGHPNSLPVRYFSESMEQQALKKKIERQATAEREAKRQEFRNLKTQYNRLMQLSAETACEMIEDVDKDGQRFNYHSSNCNSCGYKGKANSLSIDIHEWPLSSNDLEAQTTVFELSIPPVFAEWRDLTVYLIDNVLRSERPSVFSPHDRYPLQTYQGLSQYHQHSNKRRIHLLSTTKPNVVTHRRDKPISCSSEPDFGQSMLTCLRASVSRIQENWESYVALWTFSFLAARLLSMTTEDLKPQYLQLLKHCREVSYQWISQLRDRIRNTTDSSQRTEFLRVLVDICLVCVDSFNLDQQHLEEVLSEPQQASILVEVSIIIQNNANLGNMEKGVLQTTTRGRWQHTLHRSCLFLTKDVISNGNACLDLAVTRCWPPFNSGGGWHLTPSNWYWFETSFAQLEIRLNILTGELLVNGLPLSRLPWSYSNHPHYLRVFERLALDAMPSPLHGMDFSSTETFAGHKVHFSMQPAPWDSSYHNLSIRLEKDGAFQDLIPHQVLDGKLPDSLVEDFVHWYHHDTNTIEFRPLGNPWKTDPENWRLRSDGTKWKLTQGDHISLIAPTSDSGRLVASIFAALESPLRLHMLFNEEQDSLEVRLHHLQLNFDLRSGDTAIRSRQFRDMHIDADQSIGTLVGFKSKLVLRNGHDSQTRVILIPEGTVEYRKLCRDGFDDHVEASVICDTASQVHSYSIDNQLDRLVDNDTIQSKLYLAYLHGITSYCLPDPLLGRTGTEQALSILGSASVRSVACLDQKNMQLLGKIAHLSPRRSFYPPSERVMQVVGWSSDLTFLTQDDRFYKVASEILENARTIEFLYPGSSIEADHLTHADMHLVTRQIIRSASRHVSGFGAEDFTLKYDGAYESRDGGQPSGRAARASKTAYMIYHDHQFLLKTPPPDLVSHLYRLLSATWKTQSFRVAPTLREMEYDSKWLQGLSTFLSKDWCRLHFAFQTNRQWLNKFQLMIWLATISYATNHVPQVTQALLAMSYSSGVSAVALPSGLSFDLLRGYQAQSDELSGPIRQASNAFQQSPEAALLRLSHESEKSAKSRRKRLYKAKKKDEVQRFCDQLMQQWPCPTPQQPTGSQIGIYINGAAAMKTIRPMWSTWHENLLFKEYIEKFVDALKTIPIGTLAIPSFPSRAALPPTTRLPGFVSINTLFTNPAPSTTPGLHELPSTLIEHSTARTGSHKLLDVLDLLDLSAKFDNERQYLAELRSSLSHLQDAPTLCQVANRDTLFQRYLEQCETHIKSVYQSLSQAIGAVSGEPKQVSPILLLQQLTNSRWCRLSSEWKDIIVVYGEAIAALQQAKRLVQLQHNEVDLLKELENLGSRGWDPREYPEWLLLECESGIKIREAQQQIARQMMNPPDGRNAMMQLNMGEGKSTVIAPIVAAALSDGSKLVRVIVAKPQAKQMFHFLVSKLSGLLDRPVYQFPFSRAIRMDPEKVDAFRQLVTKCMEEGGILLVQPEHLLSFQLVGLEYQIDGATEVAGKLLEMQRFFDKSSRDVVDESDENFSVKFELVYTHGQQRPMEHGPERWVVIQEVLGLFVNFAKETKNKFPESVDLDERYSERFPRIRVLRPDAEGLLLSCLASHICDKGITGLPLARQPLSTREAVRRYILEPVPSPEDIAAVEDSSFWAETTVHNILLLRGLLAGGILAFVFGLKRWRVNYGTDTKREKKTRLAVPFRAKDSPTPRSEFSHPDVVIVLTCLSYYYSGLEDEDLFGALNLLTRSDNADLEYQSWVVTAPSLPLAFKQLNGINLRDRVQCTSEVFQHLRYSKGAIDYFLSHMVFAKELKEFPHKLTASGWDLGKVKQNPTTGFSGTNDSRYVLPLDVEQLDLPEQKHTNSLVLEYLLRPENSTALMPPRGEGANSDCEALLGMVTKMGSNTRVILDVGAQVIDLNNRDFAEAWLKMYEGDPTTQAVVFFSDADELMVLDHSGKVEVLQTSPFAKLLDQCLIFLDEAHTRGTDLKLPEFYRAAVTLGANLTKDRLVQACMRMRKLGKGQSVVFCVPREIERKISRQRESWSSSQPPETERLTVSNVVCWAISETWTDLRRTIPLWVTQGLRFYRQDRIWEQFQFPQGDQSQGVEWARRFLEEEAESLDHRYRPRTARQNVSAILDQVAPAVGKRFQHQCHQFGITEFGTASLQEEQERELSPETEQERQVEKPPRVKAADHAIESGLRDFIKRGKLPDDRQGFQPAFMALSNTTAAKHLDVAEFPSHVWVTDDFVRTIQTISRETDCSDSFQRPVQWVLTSASPGNSVVRHIVIISPYEANELLPRIQASRSVTLHLYSPRINLGFQPLDHLGLYTVPRRAPKHDISYEQRIQLNLFAGQLYLSSFQEYTKVCDALGLASSPTQGLVVLEADGFIPPDLKEGKVTNQSGFTKSPVKFMKVLMSGIRQNCEAIEKTCMGKILDGVLLTEEDFVEG
ncbi:hypothetical protein BKA56DRAFT_550226 [Ilyonectria sp. MPI-CAGE-AT-0026]|nr:hypothetical protein BKA56DRAFT_550226 [Ilyonectria sp. MPI-CAGE-AT-0026]